MLAGFQRPERRFPSFPDLVAAIHQVGRYEKRKKKKKEDRWGKKQKQKQKRALPDQSPLTPQINDGTKQNQKNRTSPTPAPRSTCHATRPLASWRCWRTGRPQSGGCPSPSGGHRDEEEGEGEVCKKEKHNEMEHHRKRSVAD